MATYKRAETTKANEPLKMVSGEIPVPPPGSVRVKLAFSGVCHSDVHILSDWFHLGEEKFRGWVMGHEISGYIDEVGTDVDLSAMGLQKGDPVMVFPWVACQNCDTCRMGYSNICPDLAGHSNDIGCSPVAPGGYQTHLVTKPQYLLKVPASMSMDVACMIPCSVGTSYSSLCKLTDAIEFQLKRGKARLLVVGSGGLGLWGIQLAKVMFGGEKIHVVAADVEQSKLDTAKKFGADETVLWDKAGDLESNVQKTTQNGKMHAAVDFACLGSSTNTALKCLEMNGAIVLVGLSGNELKVNTTEVVLNQTTIQGNRVCTFDELKTVANLVAQHKLTYPALQYHPLEEVYEVICMLKERKINGRAIIKH